MDALWNSAESDKAIEESQEITSWYSPPPSPHFSPLRSPYPWLPTPRNSEESDNAIEESQEMTSCSIPPAPTDSSPLRSPYPWSPTNLPWSPSYLDQPPTDFSQLSTDFLQSSAYVPQFSPLPEPCPSSNSVVACRGSNQSMETPPHFQQFKVKMIFTRYSQNLKLQQRQLLRLQRRLQQLQPQERLQLVQLVPKLQQLCQPRSPQQLSLLPLLRLSLQQLSLWQLSQLQLSQLQLLLQQPMSLLQLLLLHQSVMHQSQNRLSRLLRLLPKLLRQLVPLLQRQLQPRQLLPMLQRRLQPRQMLLLQRRLQPRHPLQRQERLQLLQQQQRLQLLLQQQLLQRFELLQLLLELLPPLQRNSSDVLNLNPTRNIGTFNTAEEAAIAHDRMVVRPSFLNKNIVELKTAHIIETPPWSAQQEDDPYENSIFGCKEATRNDEIEATGEDQMGEGELNSGILEKRKGKVKTLGRERETKKSGAKIAIPLEDILQVKGMNLKEAAINLDVSKSTLKRVCREHDIPRWPPRKTIKLISNSLPTETLMDIDRDQIPQSSSNILPPNQTSASVDTNTVTVKARSEKGITIKFQLSSPWRRVELEQQVEMRLPLEAGTYYIKYKDEENDLIWIACDEDLEDYISTSTSMGASLIDVFLVPK